MNKTILAVDTCTELCSVALSHNGEIYHQEFDAPREHSQRLLPMVDEILKTQSLKIKDVDVLAFGRGPGSFTGIRICTSMVQGLALGADKPLAPVSTLAAMATEAFEHHDCDYVATAIDARMGEVYFALYQKKNDQVELVIDEQVISPEQLMQAITLPEGDIIAVGTGFEAYESLFADLKRSEHGRLPKAKYMIPDAQRLITAGALTDVDNVEPIYLRNTVTWKKLPGRE
ncbi:tRNA (adenosine(37)-N6)-threonylcarbamoyltransferase complex dimerization subunit type 1 TsaB [Paraferrimonas sp. SM1919]|uniref:tRNA (adenosine(37)-N6)-threonylcarbamoyltransferase complex dimerization subunit type 1 TsaB n=1 Tax=Paraferrimonas sp. SM1919 TaxID=2662263 RepID=UPI0013D5ECE5|nr:tRNA (adenosine(37)-N6)-threonylcarbamoyltransferase complex dimerization subunit type 1 TsaB [Paraferrimonas sp. SM1919]